MGRSQPDVSPRVGLRDRSDERCLVSLLSVLALVCEVASNPNMQHQKRRLPRLQGWPVPSRSNAQREANPADATRLLRRNGLRQASSFASRSSRLPTTSALSDGTSQWLAQTSSQSARRFPIPPSRGRSASGPPLTSNVNMASSCQEATPVPLRSDEDV
jgi:hypothetical protein